MTGARKKAITGISEFLINFCCVGRSLLQLFARIMPGTLRKKMSVRKKLLISWGIFVGLLFFAAPWLWIDNGEDVIENKFVHAGLDEKVIFKKHLPECRRLCDGSCYRVKWVPFGVKVSACTADYYFVSFWGQKFYID
jgi:hypothetical protein